ncbi:MAG: metal-binding protein [Chitinophagaceae bacterium]|nr:metal-binding protein [Chitinophagaceae bacterium]
MIRHEEISDSDLRDEIRRRSVCLAGNSALKIYGILNCASGKRMKKKNRVFFRSFKEANELGFRPCGHCMKEEYKKWKNGSVQF